MEQYYRILDWDRYEVDTEGRPWMPGRSFRPEALDFMYIPIGDKPYRDERHLQQAVGPENALRYRAMFYQLVVAGGGHRRELREGGIVRDEEGRPATMAQIARMLRLSLGKTKMFLEAVSGPQIHWMDAVLPEEGLLPRGSLSRKDGC